jgi:hypothetical protein
VYPQLSPPVRTVDPIDHVHAVRAKEQRRCASPEPAARLTSSVPVSVRYCGCLPRGTTTIATRLSLSVRAVEAHHADVMRKLALRIEADLVRYVPQHYVLSDRHTARDYRVRTLQLPACMR